MANDTMKQNGNQAFLGQEVSYSSNVELTRGHKDYDSKVKNLEGILNKIGVVLDTSAYRRELDAIQEEVQNDPSLSKQMTFAGMQLEYEGFIYGNYSKRLDELTKKVEEVAMPYYELHLLSSKLEMLLEDVSGENIPEILMSAKTLLDSINSINTHNKEEKNKLIDKAYQVIYSVILYEEIFDRSELLNYLNSLNIPTNKENIGRLLEQDLKKMDKKDLLEEDLRTLRSEGLGYDYLNPDFIRKVSRKTVGEHNSEYQERKREAVAELKEEVLDLTRSSGRMVSAFQDSKNTISKLYVNKALLTSRILSMILVPVIAFSAGHAIGKNASEKIPMYKTITRTVNSETGEIVGEPTIVYDEAETTYVATVMEYGPWKKNPTGVGYVRNVTAYEYIAPENPEEGYHATSEDLAGNVREKYRYVEPKDILEEGDSTVDSTILITETYQDKSDVVKSSKYIIPFSILGAGIGIVFDVVLAFLGVYNLEKIKRMMEKLNRRIQEEKLTKKEIQEELIRMKDDAIALQDKYNQTVMRYGNIDDQLIMSDIDTSWILEPKKKQKQKIV